MENSKEKGIKVEEVQTPKEEEVPKIIEETKAEKKESKTFAYFIIVILIIALGYSIFQIRNLNEQLAEKPKVITNIVPDKQWYKEDCKCVEWKGEKYCSEGFAFNKTLGTWCYSPDGRKAPALVPCSKYECNECFVSLKKGFAVKMNASVGNVSG